MSAEHFFIRKLALPIEDARLDRFPLLSTFNDILSGETQRGDKSGITERTFYSTDSTVRFLAPPKAHRISARVREALVGFAFPVMEVNEKQTVVVACLETFSIAFALGIIHRVRTTGLSTEKIRALHSALEYWIEVYHYNKHSAPRITLSARADTPAEWFVQPLYIDSTPIMTRKTRAKAKQTARVYELC